MKKTTTAAMAGIALLLAGCATSKPPPTFGEALTVRSAEADRINKDWNAGEKLSRKGAKATERGEKKQKEAEKLQKESARLLENGKEWTTRGEAMKADAEARYRGLSSNPIPTSSPDSPTE